MNKKKTTFSVSYFLLALLLTWLINDSIVKPYVVKETEVSYNAFLDDLNKGEVNNVVLTDDRIIFELKSGENKEVTRNTVRVDDKELINRLVEKKVTFSGQKANQTALGAMLGWILPFLPFALLYYFIYKRMSGDGPGGGVMSFGQNKAREIQGELMGITFGDVGGVGEAETELKEIIEYLKNPAKFERLGAKLPKGILLVGPPGTGKTLLAKATAGEAGVPFFSITGSSFVEMFVGVGAARVRDLFEQAKAKAPCIIFIDEVDAIGQARNTIAGFGSNSEQESTLNQLLSEMDGFQSNSGVVIMAATNRPEILDQALVRPGRFDRQIQVVLPDEAGRLHILKIHTKGMPLAEDVDLGRIAKITPGFSGADLANIANEASLLAVRHDAEEISMGNFDQAIERVVAGLQRKTPLAAEVRRKVAYHEVGHALAAFYMTGADPVHKVSIIPTAKGALGYTLQMPEEDKYLISESELKTRMAVMLGGRAAERLIFGEVSTGAANDLERVTDIARRMVTEFGMSKEVGPVRYAAPAAQYLRTGSGGRNDLSPETLKNIDDEIKKLVEEAQQKAEHILCRHEKVLHEVASVLQHEEVISGDRIKGIAADEQNLAAPDIKTGCTEFSCGEKCN